LEHGVYVKVKVRIVQGCFCYSKTYILLRAISNFCSAGRSFN